MKLAVKKSKLFGSVEIPGSKSHTIRAISLASLACGTSYIRSPLVASDTLSAVNAYKLLGAEILKPSDWSVNGVCSKPIVADNVIDVGNSGTTLYIAMASAALVNGTTIFTGDGQIRKRPAGPLIDALNQLGADVKSTRGSGLAPIIINGPLKGGKIKLDGSKTSQYLSALLINCPLALSDTYIEVENLIEKPYVEMTLSWLSYLGIEIENQDYKAFKIPGKQELKAFDRQIPADFSSATFFLCAAAISGAELTLLNLDMKDTQGDKAVVNMLIEMGAKIEEQGNGIKITGGSLKGIEIDLSNTPDALPALAVTACFAEGETRLINVAQARLKETDRIAVMCQELTKMGADISELPDGLVIRGKPLKAAVVHGHYDHRVIMALAVAGACIEGETIIHSAEALSVTFPTFVSLMKSIGANINALD